MLTIQTHAVLGEEVLTLGFQVLDDLLLVRILDGREYGGADEQVQQIEHAKSKQTQSALVDLAVHGVVVKLDGNEKI